MASKALTDARTKLAAHGMSIQKTDAGDYRVYPKGSRNPDEGYFTDDLDDAVATGIDMAARRTKETPMRDDRDHRMVTLHDDDALQLMQHWWGSQNDPLYAIYSMGGQHEAWVFQDAIANLASDIAKVKKLGKDKFQLGKGTFNEAEINELHIIHDGLVAALAGQDVGEGRHQVVADFNTLPDLVRHAQGEGATHVLVSRASKTKIYFPRSDGQYDEVIAWRERGYWHTQRRGQGEIVGGIGDMPARAEPIETYLARSGRQAELQAEVRDYIAVDNRGRRIPGGGPFKDYGEAKRHAEKAGGYVEFTMGEAGRRHAVRDPSELRYEIEKTRNGWTVVAYSPSGVRMPLTTYPTYDAAVAGMPADKAAMSNPSYKTMGEARRERRTSSERILARAEKAGAKYAQDQIAGEHFMQWVRDQVAEAKEMQRRDPSSVFPLETKADYKKLARNMLQQLEWDTKRDMDWREILELTGTASGEITSGVPKAFFSGFTQELKASHTVDWLADEIEYFDKGEKAVGEAKRERRKPGHPTPTVWTRQNTKLATWFERDRAHVDLQTLDGATIIEWWDEAVHEAVEDGFLNPRDWHGSAVKYANYIGAQPTRAAGRRAIKRQEAGEHRRALPPSPLPVLPGAPRALPPGPRARRPPPRPAEARRHTRRRR